MLELIGSDLLILGSSMKIKPASAIAMAIKMSKGKVIRVGIRKTFLDYVSSLVINH